MRIISGKYRGKVIETLSKSKLLRPTTAKTRESIFNIIKHNFFDSDEKLFLTGCNILDLFCGSGAMSLEAFSHGAKTTFLVDNEQSHLNIAYKNVENIGEIDNSKFLCADCTKITNFIKNDDGFDLVFIDPPYYSNLTKPTLDNLIKNKFLKKGSIIVSETSKKEKIHAPKGFIEIKSRVYSISKITIFEFEGY